MKAKKMKTVVIDRAKWGMFRLAKSDGKQCCLGFVCRAYGNPLKSLIDQGMPTYLHVRVPKWLKQSSEDRSLLVDINDSLEKTMREKEELIEPIFARHGIKIVFIGKRQKMYSKKDAFGVPE